MRSDERQRASDEFVISCGFPRPTPTFYEPSPLVHALRVLAIVVLIAFLAVGVLAW